MGISVCSAQGSDWQITIDEEIRFPQLSTNGTYLVYYVDRDEDNIECVNVQSGKKLWSKTMKDYSEDFRGRFVDNYTFVMGNENRYEFIHLADGKIETSIPIIGESWEDAMSDVKPYYIGNLGMFYFDDGWQILDLIKQKVIYRSETDISTVTYEKWKNMLIVIPNGCDTLCVLDTATTQLLHTMEFCSNSLNTRVIQHFVVNNNQMLVFNEDEILCVNLGVQSTPARIAMDPVDPDTYVPFVSDKGLYLLVSDDDKQRLYNGRDGALVWETQEGEVPGLVDQVKLYSNGKEAVLLTYQGDGKMGVYKVDMATGRKIWSQLLFEQDGTYEPGHIKGSKTGAMLGAYLKATLLNVASGMTRSRVRYYPNWSAIEEGLNPKKISEGYAYLLDTANTSQITIAMGGHIYTELKKTERETYDGEGFVVLDVQTGKVLKHKPCFMISDTKKDEEYNACKLMAISNHDHADVVVGSHDVYVARKDTIEQFGFHPENEDTKFISRLDSSVTVVVENDDDDFYEYWVFDVSGSKTGDILCARSEDKNIVFQDTTRFGLMLDYSQSEDMAAYALTAGKIPLTAKRTPLWKLSEDDVDDLDIGNFSNNRSETDSLQGIRVSKSNVYLMGGDGIAKIGKDGKCKWTHEWDVDLEEAAMGLTEVGKYIVYSMGGKTVVLANDCKGAVVGEHEIDFDDVRILIDKDKENAIVVVDVSDGLIYGYHAK